MRANVPTEIEKMPTILNARSMRRGLLVLSISLLVAACGLVDRTDGLTAGARNQAEGKYRAAYIEAKKVLQKDSKNGQAWLLLGRASLMLGDPKEALNDLQNARANGVPEAQWAVPLGQAMLLAQQYDDLLKTLSPDASLDPPVKAEVLRLRGDAQRGLRQFDQAGQSYKAALALDAKNARSLIGLAKLASASNNQDAAGQYVEQALAASPENPQAWIAKGDLAFDAGQLAEAEAAYQKVLGISKPDWLPQEHFYTLLRLASAQAQQDKFDPALANIQTLEKMAPDQAYPHYLHAVVLYKQGHLDDAVSQLQLVLKDVPNNEQAQTLMGAVNYAQGNYAQAEMYLSNAMGINSNNREARRLLALTFYREGRTSQALNTLRPAVDGSPSDTQLLALLQGAAAAGVRTPGADALAGGKTPANDPFAPAEKALAAGQDSEALRLLQAMPVEDAAAEARRNRLLVMTYVRDGRVADAVKTAEAHASKHPQDSAAHLVYGTALIAAGKRPEARAQYEQAARLEPGSLAALMSLGSLDSLEGRYKDAAGRYDTVLKHDPHNEAAMMAHSRLALLQGDKAGAIKWAKQAIDAAPKSPAPYLGLVLLYSESGQFDEAVGTAKRLVAMEPGNPAALNALGAAQMNAGDTAEALKTLQKAVDLAPQAALYRTNLARAQLIGKDTKGAESNLEQVIKGDPDQVQAVVLLATVKLQANDLPGALALARALQAKPATRAAGFALEGDLYMANKSPGDAVAAYQKGLKAHPDRPLVIKTFLALNESGAAKPETVLIDWLAKHPDDEATRTLLAQHYMSHQQNALAETQYEQLLKANPSNVGALNNLAWILTEQRDPKALALAERAYKLAPTSPSVQDTYAWALLAGDQAKTALPILAKAAKAAPKVPSIQYHLAVAQARTGDKAAALRTLESLRQSVADFDDKQAAEALYRELGGTKAGGSGS
jgi:putative PEP-CTERM system TPR-repeat lipoprotein